MVYVEVWDDYQKSVEELYLSAPLRVRFPFRDFSSLVNVYLPYPSDTIRSQIPALQRKTSTESYRRANSAYIPNA